MKTASPRRDIALDEIRKALRAFAADHKTATIESYRKGRYGILIRIVDPAWKPIPRFQRYEALWNYFSGLADAVVSEISSAALVTPTEKKLSGCSLQFDDLRPKPRKKPKTAATARRAS